MTEADKEFMRFAIMPTYRHEYLGMLEDLKNARSHFPGGYEFLRKNCEVRINAWTMLDIRKSLLPCDDVTAYALEGIRFGIDMANKPSVTVKAKVEVDPKRKGLNWLWFEELSDFDPERNGCSKEEALEILKGKGRRNEAKEVVRG